MHCVVSLHSAVSLYSALRLRAVLSLASHFAFLVPHLTRTSGPGVNVLLGTAAGALRHPFPGLSHSFPGLSHSFPWLSHLLAGLPARHLPASCGATLTVMLGVVLTALVAAALVRLRQHAQRLAALVARLDALAWVAPPPDEALAARVRDSLGRAADALGLAPGAWLPRPLLAELPLTPALVGLRRPYLLLAPSLVEELSDEELDAVLRHELAHICRRGRWLGVWGWGVEREELACDRMAARSAPEALALARAIVKARAHAAGRTWPRNDYANSAVFSLLGLSSLLGMARRGRTGALERRLARLLTLARSAPGPAEGCPPHAVGRG